LIINVKEDTFKDIKANCIFEQDGCACGDFYYQLSENLWITVYRSCRKSSNTDDERLWQLHDVVFYDDLEFSYYEKEGKRYIDCIYDYGTPLDNAKLNENDKEKLFDILKQESREKWGNEFKNEN